MYKKGDKYKITISNEDKYFRYTHDVVEFIIEKAEFGVDYYRLNRYLKNLNKHDVFEFKDDFKIERIA